jgi:hypothetical protein
MPPDAPFFVLAMPPAADLERASQALARVLGGMAIDHRPPILRELPWIPVRGDDKAELDAIAADLTTAGLRARVLHERALAAVPDPLVAERFGLLDDALVVANRKQEARLPWREVILVSRARHQTTTTATTETTSRKASMAAMAVGVPIRSKQTEVERSQTTQVTYVGWVWTATAGVRLDQDALDYAGLGTGMEAGSIANWQALLRAVATRCPTATVDVRLERAGGRLNTAPVAMKRDSNMPKRGTTVVATVQTAGNEDAITEAARLLWLAERVRRLP